VFVVDDDAAMRAAIQGLLKSVGSRSEAFGIAHEFLRRKRPDGPSCLVLDVSLPGVNGLDFQRELADAGVHIPIIFIRKIWMLGLASFSNTRRCIGS